LSTGPLSIDVYVAPMRPYTCPDQLGEGEVATWAPSSSTLISGPTEGILIDTLLTFENADQIAAWAKSFGKKITGIYITHGHSDHWLGLARLPATRAWGRRTCRRTSRPASSTCATSLPSLIREAGWRTWSAACSSCMATATSRTPYGSRPERKSLAGRESRRSGSPGRPQGSSHSRTSPETRTVPTRRLSWRNRRTAPGAWPSDAVKIALFPVCPGAPGTSSASYARRMVVPIPDARCRVLA
jgi:hypothetical protein